MAEPQPKRILIVEDTPSLAHLYGRHLRHAGYAADHAGSAGEALRRLTGPAYQAVLLDLGLPDRDGLEVLREMRSQGIAAGIIVVTANASIVRAVQAVREGAYDYLVKPLTRERLLAALEAAVGHGMLRRAVATLKPAASPESFCGFIGESPAMQAVYRTIEAAAQSKAAVFITGESGTGKEIAAEAVHNLGVRQASRFIAINCGAIPKDLMESEIFGHLKGSFTGAISDRDGAASLADGGTLFLDEVCEMDLALQTKLLRFLQTGVIQRVGSNVAERVDIRVICATNKDPMTEVRAGRLREDLYYRLHVIRIHMPALRERGGDVLRLARHFLGAYAAEEGKAFRSLAAATEAMFAAYGWPGNVRELQNVLRQAVVLHDATVLDTGMLPPGIAAPCALLRPDSAAPAIDLASAGLGASAPALRAPVDAVGRELWQIEKDAIEGTITACGGSIPKAARLLGVSPSTIYRKREAWLAARPAESA